MRQVDACIRQINVRKHNEFSAEASLHGIKIPVAQDPSAPQITEEEYQKAEAHLKASQSKLTPRMNRRGK